MEPMTIREIVAAVNGCVLGSFDDLDLDIPAVESDSRTIQEGSLFIPIIGEQFDGHAYIHDALEKGAAACLTQRDRERYLPGKCYIKVENTARALRELGKYYKKKFHIPVVAVTGSVGKTTTKDMVAAVLGERYRVLKTEGNLNTDIGTCMTLFRLTKETQIVVLEMGMNHSGEIEGMSGIAEPDVCLITNIGDSHIEFLGSRANILKAKCELFSHAAPDCVAILNGDDPLLAGLKGTLSLPITWIGEKPGLDYTALDLTSDGEGRTSCRVKTPRMTCELDIPALGRHMMYPALMAVAVGEHFGLTQEELCRGVCHFAPTKMRMNILRCKREITILDDAYNANPQSMRAAVEVLSQARDSRKIAVLGDMFELGALAPALHTGIGVYLGKAGVDCLVAVGELARNIYDAAKEAMVPEVHYCANKEEAKAVLQTLIEPRSTILVKASRGMAFEELVEYIKGMSEEW